jgi:hypothetical protein
MLETWVIDVVEGPVGIVVATVGPNRVPDLVQGYGARVLVDGRVVVLVARSEAPGLLELLDEGAPIAVTFSTPTTHATVQLKSTRAALSTPKHADLEAFARYRRIFTEELGRVGFDEVYAAALLAAEASDLVAVGFVPEQAFDQTPGPRAGRPIEQGRGGEP